MWDTGLKGVLERRLLRRRVSGEAYTLNLRLLITACVCTDMARDANSREVNLREQLVSATLPPRCPSPLPCAPVRLIVVLKCWSHVGTQARLGIATQRIRQQPRQLAVAERHVRELLLALGLLLAGATSQGRHAVTQRRDRLVDALCLFQSNALHAHAAQ